jgi:hypothetical protein
MYLLCGQDKLLSAFFLICTCVSVAKERTPPGMLLAPDGGDIPVEMFTETHS